MVSANFGHGLLSCFLDFLFMAVFDVLVKRAFPSLGVTEVVVVGHVLRTDVADCGQSKNLTYVCKDTHHCIFMQCVHDILLHPCSLIKGCLHLLQCLIRAADIASSTMCRRVIWPSFLDSSQLRGIWDSFSQSRQLVLPHFVFWQRNSLSTSTGGHSILKSQNGHSERKSKPAAARSSRCCKCSSLSNVFSLRTSCSCCRENVPLQSSTPKHFGLQRLSPSSVSTCRRGHSMQYK